MFLACPSTADLLATRQNRVPRLVMVVDDSKLQRRILAAYLTGWGFAVVEASSGDDALEKCRHCVPDMVLSDWMTPGISGLEFCRAFRALSQDEYGYFILLTSKHEKAEVAKGLDSGADDFLTKPVDPDELRARLAAGERILEMQRELTEKNEIIWDTLGELQRIYDSLDRDLIAAEKLQKSLISDTTRQFATGRLSLMLQSSGHVGGDLVGFFPVASDKLGLFAMDVSGHGISSALMTARLAGYLSASAPDQNIALHRSDDGSYRMNPPDEVIVKINELLLSEMETEHYLTLLLAQIDLNTGKAIISQAGHPHPVVQRKDGRIEHCGTGGYPVGLLENATYEQFTVQLHPGDRLLILSDGVTECPDSDGNMLVEIGLDDMLYDLHDVEGPRMFDVMLEKLADFSRSESFPDDVSGILLEFQGAREM